MGATLTPAEDEEEETGEEIDEEKEREENKVFTYEIIGTLSDHARPKPEFVTEIVKVHTNHICIMLNVFVTLN